MTETKSKAIVNSNTLTSDTVSSNIASPCMDICALDENDVCIGCYRHGQEISHWGALNNEEKLLVLEKTRRRACGEIVSHKFNT